MPVKRTYKIKQLTEFGPGRQTFIHADTKQEITIAQHYQARYHITYVAFYLKVSRL